MIKSIKAIFIFLPLLASTNILLAQDYKTSLGVRLSNDQAVINNSISLKHFLNDRTALDVLFSFSDPVAIGALVAIHKPISGTEGLKWYYGGGPYVSFGNNTGFGAQGVLGIDYKFPNIPLNLSLDWKPELNIVSDINFEPSAIGFTVRFTFGEK